MSNMLRTDDQDLGLEK